MSTVTLRWWRAAIMVIAPVLLLAAFLYHPFLPGAGRPAAIDVAQAAEADPGRWALAHLLTLFAVALFALAFVALRGRRRNVIVATACDRNGNCGVRRLGSYDP
jgi:hypothetical protein